MIKIKVNSTVTKELKAKLVNSAKTAVLEDAVFRLKKATPVDTGFARDSWRVEKDRIINPAEYISHLNQGSSRQAPAFFIESAIISTPGVSPKGVIVQDYEPQSSDATGAKK